MDIDKIVDIEWVRSEMDQAGMKPKDLCRLLCIDKSTISILLNGDRPLTKWQKACFYYFFKSQIGE